ncbi:hypothetical protein N7478_000140 [Penicillium angulare]|uniref:uncharacterized protein n=1 Tax=Penicillium angulare TaxID=116970 RepID=UPI002540D1E2|nr:uncharacterized protein N7478_000140 [Penicillium angulare]KAJ5290889.1 hypothetical protein N7478_000140 [Penicillium angulare]
MNLVSASERMLLPIFTGGDDRNNAVSHIDTKDPYRDAIFTEAAQLLDSLKSSPSCHRVAATKLITSCQTLDGKEAHNRGEYEALDRTRSVYAARLAICELDGAGASIPPACLPLTASPPQPRSRFLFSMKSRPHDPDFDDYPKEILEPCLKTLESRPQWWTSYSNNRQNAMVICEATRMETQKDELLNLHRSIVDSSAKLSNGLIAALQNTAMDSARNQEFLESVQALQRRLLVEMEESDLTLHDTFVRLLNEVEAGIDTMMALFTSSLSNLQNETANLGKNIATISGQVNTLQQSLTESHEAEILRSKEVLRVHEENSLVSQQLALDMHLAVESNMNTDLTLISQRMANLDSSLEWLTSRLNHVLKQENELAYKLETMEKSVEISTNKANELQAAQHEQVKALNAQVQVHEEIQFAAQLSKALMEKAAATAANLQATIEDAAVKAKSILNLQLGGFLTWATGTGALLLIGTMNATAAIGIFFMVLGGKLAFSYLRYF